MKCFEVILFASGHSVCDDRNEPFHHKLGVIFAGSREEAEETLGVKHGSAAPPFLAAKIPPPLTHTEDSKVYDLQRYDEGKVLFFETPMIQTRKGLESVVASTDWAKLYCYKLP